MEQVYYIFQEGDTLQKVSDKTGVTVGGLVALNPIFLHHPRDFQVGMKIKTKFRVTNSNQSVVDTNRLTTENTIIADSSADSKKEETPSHESTSSSNSFDLDVSEGVAYLKATKDGADLSKLSREYGLNCEEVNDKTNLKKGEKIDASAMVGNFISAKLKKTYDARDLTGRQRAQDKQHASSNCWTTYADWKGKSYLKDRWGEQSTAKNIIGTMISGKPRFGDAAVWIKGSVIEHVAAFLFTNSDNKSFVFSQEGPAGDYSIKTISKTSKIYNNRSPQFYR